MTELHQSKGIEVLFFGCTGIPGHDLHWKQPKPAGFSYRSTPWGGEIDGGLLTSDYHRADTTPTPNFTVAYRDGWTALSFWDRSGGDSRPGCNSAFLADADISAETLLVLAKEQWPEIFNRPGFPLPSSPKPV